MSTTTIRLDEALRERIAAAAERAGQTSHAWIVDSIARSVAQSELDSAFQAVAEQRWGELLDRGDSVAWPEAREWLRARARGEPDERPAARRPRP